VIEYLEKIKEVYVDRIVEVIKEHELNELEIAGCIAEFSHVNEKVEINNQASSTYLMRPS
jgi:hypothetical protein